MQHADRSPILTPLHRLDFEGRAIFIKDESKQRSGAFKFRGSFNFLSRMPVPTGSVVTASTGNHAAGLSLAAQIFGYKALIFVPKATPEAKLANVAAAGGEITLVEGDYETALAMAQEHCVQTGKTFVPSYDHEEIIAGNRTVFREMTAQSDMPLETIFAPIGGGGLISGALAEFADKTTQMVGVEYDAVQRVDAILEGRITSAPPPAQALAPSTEGIGIRTIGDLPKRMLTQSKTVRIEAVSLQEMQNACRVLLRRWGIRAELAAGAALAAALRQNDAGSGAVGVVVTGGNVAPEHFETFVEKEL